ncbi:MAG: PSD1 and planctomycete cytochrome C domain-containing protein [Pirellulaceae bacterium]|nr:PSD1 and planctomycete cytochrome C domain-containing protein [Pirellulaceae bacterium]
MLMLRHVLAIAIIGCFAIQVLADEPAKVADKSAVVKKKLSDEARASIRFFESRIRPVLVQHCYECHSDASNKSKGGLLVDSREAIRRSGDSGHAVVPGSVNDSLIIDALSYGEFEMPPKGQLPPEVVQDFKRWIQMGAPDPRNEAMTASDAKPIEVTNDLWSLKPIELATLPTVKQTQWPRNDIDRFVLAKLEANDMKPSDDAEATTLIRRLYGDVIGLPPPADVVEKYVRATSKKASLKNNLPTSKSELDVSTEECNQLYCSIVEDLLASPHFGERWARHWLDVARFAESNGRDRDVVYHEAWRYRQYVIDALNADMPYDRFITEQLAGDLLPADTDAERDRLRIATGFLAIGPKALSGRSEERRMDLVDEQIDVTTRAVLGLTVSCARCHDHKFDPIPTQDYYAMAGIFRSTNTLYGPGITQGQGKNGPKPYTQNLQQLSTSAPVDEDANEKEIERLTILHLEAQAEQRKWLKLIQAATEKNEKPTKDITDNRTKFLAEQRRIEAQIAKLKEQKPESDFAMAVCDAEKPSDCRVHIRGEIGSLGDTVDRGFVKVVHVAKTITLPANQSGRVELAAWLMDRENPLPARVAANRIWMHLMGDGLVGTPDNFGSMGESPTNIELLDYLSTYFRDEDWSTKNLICHIVLSRTYRQSADATADSEAKDPENAFFGRRNVRRLDAESMRDAMLTASGRIDLNAPEKSLVFEMAGGEVGRNLNMEPLQREFNFRSVYLPILRSMVPEMLKVFDFAEPSIVVGRRSETNVPVQALFFLNSPFVMEQAEAMAKRLFSLESDESLRIDRAYLLTIARKPTDVEHNQAIEFIATFGESLKGQFPDDAIRREKTWSAFCQALFASAEFRYIR